MLAGYYLSGEEKFGPVTSRFYEFISRFGMEGGLYEFVLWDLRKSSAKKFLDVGSGPGYVPIQLAQNKNLEIYCIDPSKDMLYISRKKAQGLKNIKITQGSSRSVPFKVKFDIIYTSISFHHWQKKAESLKYLKKFLAKGGEIRIYEYKRERLGALKFLGLGTHSLDESELRKILRHIHMKMAGEVQRDAFVRVSLR